MPDDEDSLSEAELRDAVTTGWHRLVTSVTPGADERRADAATRDVLGTLAALTELPFRQLDMVRRVRNQIAHPDQPVPRERLQAALRTIVEADSRLATTEPMPGQSGRSATRVGTGHADDSNLPIGYRRLTLRKPNRLERPAKHMDDEPSVERTPPDRYVIGYRRLTLRKPGPRRAFPGSQGS